MMSPTLSMHYDPNRCLATNPLIGRARLLHRGPDGLGAAVSACSSQSLGMPGGVLKRGTIAGGNAMRHPSSPLRRRIGLS